MWNVTRILEVVYPFPKRPILNSSKFKSLQTTISNLIKIEEVPQTGRKQWVKEKLLVTSNFSFTHSVFKRLSSKGRQKVSLRGNGIKELYKMENPVGTVESVFFQNFLLSFTVLSILLSRNKQFLLSSQRFPLFQRIFHHFYQIQNCPLQTL